MTTLDIEEFRQAQRREQTPENKLLREASRVIEALLFASARPLGDDVLQSRLPVALPIARVLEVLQADYRNRGVQLVRLADGWMFRTAEDLGYLLSREAHETRKLSRAALETLSVIAYHQPVTRAEIEDIRGVSIHRGTLDALLAESDWVFPTVPLTPATRHLLGREQLARMKPGAGLVNISRADVVERHALHDALASGHLGGLGLDTFYEEPGSADDPLLKFRNVIITQRIAAQPRFNAFGDLAELMAGLATALASSLTPSLTPS